ncbi:MAG: hypothetical protein U9R08_01145 [Nanoarchaeota archaeon]|nr:hypothetical protein [Nanoarchaeota archaeon]
MVPARFHMVKSEQVKDQCPYCGTDLDKVTGWESEFHIGMHYKKITCSCGKENILKVDFIGSGHDTWDGKPNWKGKIKGKDDIDELVDQEHEMMLNGDIEVEEEDY